MADANKEIQRKSEFEKLAKCDEKIQQLKKEMEKLEAQKQTVTKEVEKKRNHVKICVGGAFVTSGFADQYYTSGLSAKDRESAIRQFADSCRHSSDVGNLVEKHCGQITDMQALENYLVQIAPAIKRTQGTE